MNKEEAKQFYISKVKFESKPPQDTGGQTCGMISGTQILVCEELDLRIEIGFERGQGKNRHLAAVMFNALLDELLIEYNENT